jgi:hypothetical protein
MTPEAYFGAVKALGLTPSKVPHVFIDRNGMPRSVPDPYPMTPEQRQETLEKIKALMDPN